MRWVLLRLALAVAVSVSGALAQTALPPPVPPEAEIRKILADRIDGYRQGVGIVVGVIDAHGRRVIAHGSPAAGSPLTLDGGTLFEIGSVTKVFTALLLADMAERGEVKLDDPVQAHLPTEAKVPQRDNRAITLADLATHTSGLPRMPANFKPQDPANPYADYTVRQLCDFLSSHELTRAVGGKFEYSNVAFGLLGHALERRAGMAYEALVAARISQPLGMSSTRITLSPELRARLAVGHDADLTPVANWDMPALAGAGALRSSADDLLIFLAANLGFTRSPLADAMRAMLAERRPTNQQFVDNVLGWNVDTRGGNEIIWMGGATAGYRSFVGYSPKSRVGVVVLSNTGTSTGIVDIGLHLFDRGYRLAGPPGHPRETSVEPGVLDGYAGRYELRPKFILTVTREGDHLSVQATGQTRSRIYPMSERKFFYKAVEAQITFEPNAQGRAEALVLHQNGANQRAKRIADGEAKRPTEREP